MSNMNMHHTPTDPHQLVLPMFWPHEEMVIVQQFIRALEKRAKLRSLRLLPPKPRTGHVPDAAQVDLADCTATLTELVEPVELATEQPTMWSDQAQDELHEQLLLQRLQLLNTKGHESEKLEVLRWIFNAEIYMAQNENKVSKQWEIVNDVNIPFSFARCCKLAEMHPDSIREDLASVLSKLKMDHLLTKVTQEKEAIRDKAVAKYMRQKAKQQ